MFVTLSETPVCHGYIDPHASRCILLHISHSYRKDIYALDKLLDTTEEERLEEIKSLVEHIQETRRSNPEVSAGLKCIQVQSNTR